MRRRFVSYGNFDFTVVDWCIISCIRERRLLLRVRYYRYLFFIIQEIRFWNLENLLFIVHAMMENLLTCSFYCRLLDVFAMVEMFSNQAWSNGHLTNQMI